MFGVGGTSLVWSSDGSIGWTDCFVRFLCIFACFLEDSWLIGQIFFTKLRCNESTRHLDCLRGKDDRVCSVVRDKSFFVELLRDHHCLLCAPPQAVGGSLLEGRGGKRR